MYIKIKQMVSQIEMSTINLVGILASVISFVYYFVLKNPYEIAFWMLCIADFFLFVLSAYWVMLRFELTNVKTVIFTILIILFYFAFCEVVVWAFSQGTSIVFDLGLFKEVFLVGLFLAPSFILLIPVIMFVAEIIG